MLCTDVQLQQFQNLFEHIQLREKHKNITVFAGFVVNVSIYQISFDFMQQIVDIKPYLLLENIYLMLYFFLQHNR